MIHTALVWVLIVTSRPSVEVEQLGYYSSISDCRLVQQSKPLRHFDTECVQVNVVIGQPMINRSVN